MIIAVGPATTVSAVAQVPRGATACLVLAHGAGAGMNHPFMVTVCDGLSARGIATLRYQFPYMERGSRRPDRPDLCHATVRAAVAAAHDLAPTLPLFAGGKSFGGRMTSQTQVIAPLPQVRGLCFFGFPLHMPGKPATTRADHLASVNVPMLFLQGSRDELAQRRLMVPLTQRLGDRATLIILEHADHSFHVLRRSGTTDEQVLESLLDAVAAWVAARV